MKFNSILIILTFISFNIFSDEVSDPFENLNRIREEFKSIGQVPKKHSKLTWNKFREISREINREKNNFYNLLKLIFF